MVGWSTHTQSAHFMTHILMPNFKNLQLLHTLLKCIYLNKLFYLRILSWRKFTCQFWFVNLFMPLSLTNLLSSSIQRLNDNIWINLLHPKNSYLPDYHKSLKPHQAEPLWIHFENGFTLMNILISFWKSINKCNLPVALHFQLPIGALASIFLIAAAMH